MQTNIYLVRHGEVYNPKNILYGRLPRFVLSKKGIKQIEKTALFLKNKSISFIYSSPVLRARQTAKILQKTIGSEIKYLTLLQEIKTYLEGKPFDEVDLLHTDYYSPALLGPMDETMEEIGERMEKVIKKIVKKHPGESVVLVSHGDPIMILEARLKNLPMEIASIRGIPYITHGEVVHILVKNDKETETKRLFIPEIDDL